MEGSKEDIQKVKAQLNAPYERTIDDETRKYSNPIIAFWNICRPPEDKMEEYEGVSGYEGGERKGETEYNWYVFNNREWGTKWDIGMSDGNKYCETSLDHEDETSLTYRFSTAWSPPLPVIETLSKQYPKLEMTLEYEEEQGWGGEVLFTEEGSSVIREYEAPNSHQDFVDRDQIDSCPCQNEAEEDYWHKDCPREKELTLSHTRLEVIK